MTTQRVEMRLDPKVVSTQSSFLRLVTGFLCPFSLVAGLGNPQDDTTFDHECYHYMQMVTTPFGVYLNLLACDLAFELGQALRSCPKERIAFLQMPLIFSAWKNSLLPSKIRDTIVVNSIARSEYIPWFLDNEAFVHAPPPNENELEVFVGTCLDRTERFLAYLGGSKVESTTVPRFPNEGNFPMADGRCISCRDVLENAATAASTPPEMHVLKSVEEYVEKLKRSKPRSYVYLIERCASLCPKHESTIGFQKGFLSLCDVALFGPLLPDMESYRTESISWKDMHPSWRLYKLLSLLKQHKQLCGPLFATNTVSHKAACDKLCELANWPIWSEVINEFRFSYDEDHLLGWILGEFNRAMEYRISNNNLMNSTSMKYLMLTLEAFEKGTTGSYEEMDDIRERLFSSREANERWFVPSVVVINGEVSYSAHSTAEMRKAIRSWYYALHFSERLLHEENLNYPIPLSSKEDIQRGFELWFGISPDQITRHPLVLENHT